MTPRRSGRITAPTNVRLLSLALAATLTIPTQYWVSRSWTGFSIMSLFIQAVFVTFAVAGANVGLRRIAPRAALRPGEMLMLYTMLAVAQAACGHDTIEMLTQAIAYPAHFTSAENDWRALFHHLLPRWLFVWEPAGVAGLYTDGMDLYEDGAWRHYLRPGLFWSGFLVTLYFLMMCLNVLLKRQWVERERLSFPVAQIPLGIVDPSVGLFRSRLFWWSCGGAACLNLLNGLHRLFPLIPGPTYGKYNFGALLSEHPWNVIGDVHVEFLPFVVGLSYFIPVALSFSIWFFYWFWKAQHVLGAVVGLRYIPEFPGFWIQGMGAMMLMAFLFMHSARRHLAAVARGVSRPRAQPAEDDSPYRFAVWGAMGAGIALLVFLHVAGMSLWIGSLFLAGHFTMTMVTTRLRAQLGLPTHELPFTTSSMLVGLLGVKRLDTRSLAQVATFKFVDFGQRGSPMPTMMESMYMRDRLRLRQPGILLLAIMFAAVIGTLVGFAGNLQRGHMATVQTWVGDSAFPTLSAQVRDHTDGVDFVYVSYFVVGAAVVVGLNALSRAYVWWPFHPLGYIMGGEWMLRHLWSPIFMAWAIRVLVLKLGGMSAHRRATHVFLGVTIGDAAMLGMWAVLGSILNRWTLTFTY